MIRSSGKVTISAKLKTGKNVAFYFEYDYIPPFFCDNDLELELELGFDRVSTGAGIIEALEHFIAGFDRYASQSEKGEKFKKIVLSIQDISDVSTIRLQETVKYEGDFRTYRFDYTYTFCGKKKNGIFVLPEDIMPSFNTYCTTFGQFSIEKDGGDEAIESMIESRGWKFVGRFENLAKENVKHDYRLFIIGDITAEKIEKDGVEKYLEMDEQFRYAKMLQIKHHFLFVKESDFASLEKCIIPWDKCPSEEELSKHIIFPINKWSLETECGFDYIFNCGLTVSYDLNLFTLIVVTNNYYDFEYTPLYGEKSKGFFRPSDYHDALHMAYYLSTISKKKPLVVSEGDFLDATTELRKRGRKGLIPTLDCKNMVFMICFAGKDKTQAIKCIEERGGIVSTAEAKNIKKVDVIIYKEIDYRVMNAEELVAAGKDIILLSFEEFKEMID